MKFYVVWVFQIFKLVCLLGNPVRNKVYKMKNNEVYQQWTKYILKKSYKPARIDN